MEFNRNLWYDIRLRVDEKKIQAWIDDEQVIDLETEDRKFTIWWEQEVVRPLGIATWNTGSALREIRIKPLTTEKPATEKPAIEK